MSYVEARRKLVAWLRRQLIGPAGDGNLRVSPLDRYPTGVLYPIQPGVSGTDPAAPGPVNDADPALPDDDEEEEDAPVGAAVPDTRAPARPVRRRRYVPPSAVGFSFFARGDVHLSVAASAAVYTRAGDRDDDGRFRSLQYERTALEESVVAGSVSPFPEETLWDGRAGVDVRARPFLDGLILTVTLFNRQRLGSDDPLRSRAQDLAERSLFEVRLECVVEGGEVVEYPRIDPSLLTDEEQELELQYRDRRIHAVGHGAAVDWRLEPGRPGRIRSEFMPTADVPLMTVDTGDAPALDLQRLARGSHSDDLARFAAAYGAWTVGQREAAGGLPVGGERDAARRLCDRMGVALGRMQRAVELLRTDRVVAESFRLANRAMLEQMRQADRVEGRETGTSGYRWRPFQLAFLLTVMESAIREDDDFRDVLDLIWFPTGGGKTEAYLGLVAFLIVWRRLRHPGTGGGTAAFMRYTLRLLTRQQFERAARMICALELLRREHPERLGAEPIDAGIWVGAEISPNRFAQAMERVEDLVAGRSGARHALLVERCPWCRESFDAARGYDATEDDFHFHCTNGACAFGADDRPLPCNVVDEALYRRPPSLLIGTIDKFARLAWETRTGAFFGLGSGRRSRPPELIIQDELHLITGPLGSLAGLYEAGIDTLLARRGVRAKYVASHRDHPLGPGSGAAPLRPGLGRLPAARPVLRRLVLRPHGPASPRASLRRLPGAPAGPTALSGAARRRAAGRSAGRLRRASGPGGAARCMVDAGDLPREPEGRGQQPQRVRDRRARVRPEALAGARATVAVRARRERRRSRRGRSPPPTASPSASGMRGSRSSPACARHRRTPRRFSS